jgi:hypothetical protein
MSWFGGLAPCLAKTSDARQQGGPGVHFFVPVPPVPHLNVHGLPHTGRGGAFDVRARNAPD